MNLPSSALSSLGSPWWGGFFGRRPRFGTFLIPKVQQKKMFDQELCYFLKLMLDHFANAISHLWNPGTIWEKFAPPKMCSKMPFSPLEKKNLRCFSAFLPDMFFLKISVSKRCLSLTAVKTSLRFTPRGFPPFLWCGFPRPEGIASILIRFTPSPGPSWLFGTSDLGRTELRWWDVFFGRWKLVVFSESLKKVGGFMVGQSTPLLMYPSRKKALLYTPLCLEGGR